MVKLNRVNAREADSQVCMESIPISSIRPNPYQPRRYFSESAIAELAQSIKMVGLLQPINVRRTGQGGYELIAGERRLRACMYAGLTHILAIIQAAMVDQDSAMIAMIENLQRENLHFFEEAEGYLNLIREHGFTQDELAKRLSKNQSTIANKLRILKLPSQVKAKIIAAGLTERHARSLLRLHNEQAQLRLLKRISEEGMSVKETEELVEHELNKIYGEERLCPETRSRCGHRFFLATLKRTLEKLSELGANIKMDIEDEGSFMSITIRLEKC